MPLMSVGGSFQLEQIAGESYLRCIGAGLPSGITSAYRDPKRQQWLYDQWRAGVPGFNFALPPDKSMHCKGLALDLPVPAREWMRDHGKPYGWYGVPNEAWHFNYVAAFDQHAHDNTEDDMNAEQEAKVTHPVDQKGLQVGKHGSGFLEPTASSIELKPTCLSPRCAQ